MTSTQTMACTTSDEVGCGCRLWGSLKCAMKGCTLYSWRSCLLGSMKRLWSEMQVLLLMQSSDRIVHDVCHAYDFCGSSSDMQSQAVCPIATLGSRPPLTLVLRQWHTILPGREFRCFVHRNQVVGWPLQSFPASFAPSSQLSHFCS